MESGRERETLTFTFQGFSATLSPFPFTVGTVQNLLSLSPTGEGAIIFTPALFFCEG
jgi:hypothetical protein